MPPVFILLALAIERQSCCENVSTLNIVNRIGGLFAVTLFALIPFAMSFIKKESLSTYDFEVASAGFEVFMNNYYLLAVFIVFVGVINFIVPQYVYSQKGKNSYELSRSLVFSFLVLLAVNFVLLPLIDDVRQRPVKEAAELAKTIEEPLISWRIAMPSFSVYSDRIVPERPPELGDTVLTRSTFVPRLKTQFGEDKVHFLFQKNGIVLIRISDQI
jgi:hypothetical protein